METLRERSRPHNELGWKVLTGGLGSGGENGAAGFGAGASPLFAEILSDLQSLSVFPFGLIRPETAAAPGPTLSLGNRLKSRGSITCEPGQQVPLLCVCRLPLQ